MLLIFDLDGTLLNTLEDLASAANHALGACGFAPRSVAECCQFVGNGVTKLLERALPDGAKTPENIARMRAEFLAYYDQHLWDATHPYPSILETLSALQARGIKLAVASNKYQHATEKLIAHFFPQISFSAVYGQRDGVPVKPHPQIVQDCLSAAQVSAEYGLFVGDSDVDMQTAHNADVRACGVTWGFRPREVLAAYQPAYLIDTPHELVNLV